MSLLLLLVLAAMSESPQVRTSPSSVIEGDQMTLSCRRRHGPDAAPPQVQFAIYRNERKVQELGPSATYTVPSARLEDSGNYTCAVRDSSGGVQKTGVVSIQVEDLFSTPEIRTRQSSVTEGDEMTLTCDAQRNPARAATQLEFAFYRDGWNEQDFSASATYSVPSALLVHSGNYTCEVRTPSGRVRKRSNVLYIQIEALFLTPEIRTNRSSVTEGDEMTLTCDTRRHPLAAATELEFAFYREQRMVQEFNVSATYRVPIVQLCSSGNYTCEVRTPRVRKRSAALSIQVQATFDTPEIRTVQSPVVEGDDVTLTCDTRRHPAVDTMELEFAFYRNEGLVQEFSASPTYRVPPGQWWRSQYYTCHVRKVGGRVRKRSDKFLLQIEALFDVPVLKTNRSSVTEGDEVTLTCDSRRHPARAATKLEFAFLRYEWTLQFFSASATYSIPSAQQEHSGRYACVVRTPSYSVEKRSDMINIQVQAAFDTPKLRPNRLPVMEGDEMTLTCHVTRSPARSSTGLEITSYRDRWYMQDYSVSDTSSALSVPLVGSEDYTTDVMTPSSIVQVTMDSMDLEFAFYRDGRVVQKFSASATYSVPAAELVHSGFYTCEVRTPSGRVRKRSELLYIEVKAVPLSLEIYPGYQVTEGDIIRLVCWFSTPDARILEFAFYRNERTVQEFNASDVYTVPHVRVEDSGKYTCKVRTPSGTMRKRSHMKLLQVAALFDPPQIIISPSSVAEGDEMTLTCDTRRYCGRTSTELEFAFYRDWQIVQDFGESDAFSVASARPAHSGNYTCEARTFSESVRKESMNVLYVQVAEKELPLPILLGAIYGSLAVIILICVLLAWKCRSKKAARNVAASSSKSDNSSAPETVVEPTES